MTDLYHLPALTRVQTGPWRRGGPASGLRTAQVTREEVALQIAGLRRAREEHLADRPVDGIVSVIDHVAGRFLDPADPLRREAMDALPRVTGMSREMTALVLDRMAADWRREPLERLLRSEFGDPRVLDDFIPLPGRNDRTRAFGPGVVLHFFSGNIPGVAVTSLVRAMLVKSASLGKTAAGEPILPALFARGISETDDGLGRCLAVVYWRGGDRSIEYLAHHEADAVIAYGGEETIKAIRSQVPPGRPFLAYGRKVSFGVVAREAIAGDDARRVAEDAALAVATFDQQGCVSPHLIYVERGAAGAVERWVAMLAEELERLRLELPRADLDPGEHAAIVQLRGAAEFAPNTKVLASESGTDWTVVHARDAAFEPSCLNRVIRIAEIDDLDEVASRVAGLRTLLQSVGVAGPEERIGRLAAGLAVNGVSRVTPFAALAWPPAEWHHDGRPPLADLVRWCDFG